MIIAFCFYCRLCGSHMRQIQANFLPFALQGGICKRQECHLCVFAQQRHTNQTVSFDSLSWCRRSPTMLCTMIDCMEQTCVGRWTKIGRWSMHRISLHRILDDNNFAMHLLKLVRCLVIMPITAGIVQSLESMSTITALNQIQW